MKMECREGEDNRMVVEGYACTFGQAYDLYDSADYKITEQIDARAFDGCDMSDVIMQYDHEGRVFARNRNNTLSLMVDSAGLKITAELGGTDIGRQLYQEIKGGYTDKMSFAFAVAEDKRETLRDHETGKVTVVRTITKIKKLYDVSAVSIPANGMTSISARRFADGVIGQIKAERLKRAKTVLNIKLKLMGA
ncbi:MAG TPA: HK97 family phage prohead protease [Candidatus Gemmiger avicola]|uniref:HK97 family phage prohead protease n=1 Tax=Candidatus Gemmiger avicola TaxID=2838605 RepID=A0A9D2S2M5_9FIRM|nr:HK97 family phage prohead protease [Candidatus Gemmiger avicola]